MNALKREMAPKKVCLVVGRLPATGKARGSIPTWGEKTTGTWHFLIWPQNQIAQEWHLWVLRSESASDLGLPEPILQLTAGGPLHRVADSEHRVPLLRYILYIYKWRTDLLGGFPSCPPADDVFPLKRVRCFIYVVFQNTYIAPYEIRLRRYSKAFMAISALQWTTIDVF